MDKIIPNLVPGKTYKLRYRSVDGTGAESGNSVVYEFTVDSAPAPPEVDQDTISVVTASNGSGVIIRWIAPTNDSQKPPAVRYVVEISDTPDFINKVEIDANDTTTYFSNEMLLTSFGVQLNIIYIRVLSVSSVGSSTIPAGYKRFSYLDEAALRPPDIVVASGAVNKFLVSWTYIQTTPASIEGFIVYKRLATETSWTQVYAGLTSLDRSYEAVIAIGTEGDYYIGVSAYDVDDNESSIKQSNLITVNAVGDVDTTAPSVPTGLSAETGIDKTAIVSWNASATGSPFGYRLAVSTDESNWTNYDTPGTSYTLYGLTALTTYYVKVAAYDYLFNLSSYSSVYNFVTPADVEKPSTPAVIQILVQNTAQTGSQNIVVKHSNKKANNTDFLETDIARFDVYVSNTNTNSGGTYIGTIPATSPTTTNNTGYGSSGTIVYDSGVAAISTKYFYTKVVDDSGNASDASATSQAAAITYIDNAFIGDLTADRIRTGTLAANQAIYVGTGTDQITIKSDNTSTPVGKIFSGTGTYNNTNTGFYLDSTGQFSLKDKLTWNPTTQVLSINGLITATGGSFTGNVHVDPGSLYAGASASSGQRLVFNSTGISGYNSSGVQTMSLATDGTFNFTAGRIGSLTAGWELGSYASGTYIRSTSGSTGQITLFNSTTVGTPSKIYIATPPTVPAWKSASTSFYVDSDNHFSIGSAVHYDGTTFQIASLKADATKIYSGVGGHGGSTTPFYVDGSGNFSLGDKVVWNGSTLSINGSGSFTGAVTATSGSFTGTVSAGSGNIAGINFSAGRLYSGTSGNWANSNTGFYVDLNGYFSLKDKFYWNPDAGSGAGSLYINGSGTFSGNGTFSGSLSAASGSFTGSLSGATGSFSGTISSSNMSVSVDDAGTGFKIYRAGTQIGKVSTNTSYNMRVDADYNDLILHASQRVFVDAGSGNPIYVTVSGGANIRLEANSGDIYAPSVGHTSGSATANVRFTSGSLLQSTTSTQSIKNNIYKLSDKSPSLSETIFSEKIINDKKYNFKDVLNITPVGFEYINPDGTLEYQINDVGFIAEDIAEKYPVAGEYDKNGNPCFYNINAIVSSMLAVMQDQQKEIDDLKGRLLQLESKIGA